MATDVDQKLHYNKYQWSVNNGWSCKQGNCKVNWLLFSETDVLAAFIGKTVTDKVTTTFQK